MPIAKMKAHRAKDPLFAIIVSIILASVVVVYPLASGLAGWRPLFMMMVMLFWVLCQPTWCGIWFAFGTGLFVDLLLGSPLGMNALSFVIITFVSRFLTRERRIMTFFNLWTINILALVAHIFMLWILQLMFMIDFSLARHWQPLLTSILCWPLIYLWLKPWRM